jgi:hypothetical protein
VITDNGAGDADATLGSILFMGSVGGFGVNFTTGLSSPVIGGVYNMGELALGSSNIRTTAGSGKLKITLEDYGYAEQFGSRTLSSNVSGVMTGAPDDTVTFRSWASPSNSVPDFGPDVAPPTGSLLGGYIGSVPADQVAVWPGGITFGVGAAPTGSVSFAGSGAVGFLANGPYSLFTELLLDLTGPSALSISALNVAVTPEPTTMILFGTGAVAVAWARRRRKGTDASAVPV